MTLKPSQAARDAADLVKAADWLDQAIGAFGAQERPAIGDRRWFDVKRAQLKVREAIAVLSTPSEQS